MKTLLTVVSIVLLFSTVHADVATHRTPSEARQRAVLAGDLSGPFVVSGCLPTVPGASLTFAAIACEAYVRDATTGELVYVGQDAHTFGPLSDGNGVYTLGLAKDSSSVIVGWTRVPGTHYVWKLATYPVWPNDVLVIAQTTVTAGAIASLTDYRPLKTIDVSRYLNQTNPLQSAVNSLPAGAVGGTLRVPTGIIIPVPATVTTPAGMSRITIRCDSLSAGFVWTGGNSSTMLVISSAANRTEIDGCLWTQSAAQTGVKFIQFAAGVTQEIEFHGNLMQNGNVHIEALGETLNFYSHNNWYFDAVSRSYLGQNTGGSQIALSFVGDHFQGGAGEFIEIVGGSDYTFRDTIFDASAAGDSTSVLLRSFDTIVWERTHCEIQGAHAGSFCLDLGTTALGTDNMSAGMIIGSHFDCAGGTCIRLGFARGVIVEGNTFRQADTATAFTANAIRNRLGPNVYGSGITNRYTEAALTNNTILDALDGFRLPTPVTVNAAGANGAVQEGGAAFTIAQDTTNAITLWNAIKITNDTGAGSVTDLPALAFDAAAGTHSSLKAAKGWGNLGFIRVNINGTIGYIPVATQPVARSGIKTLDGATPSTVTFGWTEANTTYAVVTTCEGDVGDVWINNKTTTTFDINTDGAHNVDCFWIMSPKE